MSNGNSFRGRTTTPQDRQRPARKRRIGANTDKIDDRRWKANDHELQVPAMGHSDPQRDKNRNSVWRS
jgi:hypothetical protein